MAMTACSAKFCDQLDLLVGERSDLLAVDADRTDQLVVLEHRHQQEGPCAAEIGERNNRRGAFAIRQLRRDVLDLHDLPGSRDLGKAAPGMGADQLVQPRSCNASGTPCAARRCVKASPS